MNKSGLFSVMGLLIGFTVVGLIGIVVGDELIDATNTSGSWAGDSTSSIIETFQTGVTLCKIVVIVSVTLIIMKKLFSTGVLSKFDDEGEGKL